MTCIVTLPFVPTPLNQLMRMHWSKRNRILKKEYYLINHCCSCANIPPAIGKRRITQRITLVGNDRRRDSDGAWKGLLDGLVKCKRLVDDGPDWVETMPVEFERGNVRQTVITIEDIEEKAVA